LVQLVPRKETSFKKW